MYYHVIIEPKVGGAEYKTDLSKDQLVSRFLEPYEKGCPIVINGKTIEPVILDRIQIAESEVVVESFIPELKAEDRESSVAIIGGPTYTLRAIWKAKDVTDEYIEGPIGYLKDSSSQKSSGPRKTPNRSKKKVFIVHGHDEMAQTKAARYVEKLGLEAIILHEKASSGRTIIEKIEHYSDVGFAIVLYTPDDVGSKKGDAGNLMNRGRQNVVFEHGYLIGKLGRGNVCALVDGEIELPNDISGVVYIRMDSASAWQLQVAKEMKQLGYQIDLNRLA